MTALLIRESLEALFKSTMTRVRVGFAPDREYIQIEEAKIMHSPL